MSGRYRVRLVWLGALSAFGACGQESTGPPSGNGTQQVTRVDVAIDVASGRSPISPFIYGSNQDRIGNTWTVRRWGGNRTTGYNWENNFSNAGIDWLHQSDLYLITHARLPESDGSIPGRAVSHHHQQSLDTGAESVITLQMAGYVAADGEGPVAESETAPSQRWVPVVFAKGAPFAAEPDLGDGHVYMDELVHALVQTFGPATSGTGVRWYSLDNEPALWAHTHPRLHPEPVGAHELLDRSIALAAAVKDVDPGAGIVGPALYGMAAFETLQDAPDWGQQGAGYDWLVDYYLAGMRAAEAAAGRRLLDVLDVHWYPEATGDHRITDENATTRADVEARLQAPRTLWDPTYTENSWIGRFRSRFLPLLPRLKRSIDEHYPGTALAITEYAYGGGAIVSGGLAQADVLGAFGRYGVDLACLWGIESGDAYQGAGFLLYRGYDQGAGAFGSTSVPAVGRDVAKVSAWASIEGEDVSLLHVILINKELEDPLDVRLTVSGGASYTGGRAWGFGPSSPSVTELAAVPAFVGNTLTYRIPALTAVHLVLN